MSEQFVSWKLWVGLGVIAGIIVGGIIGLVVGLALCLTYYFPYSAVLSYQCTIADVWWCGLRYSVYCFASGTYAIVGSAGVINGAIIGGIVVYRRLRRRKVTLKNILLWGVPFLGFALVFALVSIFTNLMPGRPFR